jgi:hypothetical protein
MVLTEAIAMPYRFTAVMTGEGEAFVALYSELEDARQVSTATHGTHHWAAGVNGAAL